MADAVNDDVVVAALSLEMSVVGQAGVFVVRRLEAGATGEGRERKMYLVWS